MERKEIIELNKLVAFGLLLSSVAFFISNFYCASPQWLNMDEESIFYYIEWINEPILVIIGLQFFIAFLVITIGTYYYILRKKRKEYNF